MSDEMTTCGSCGRTSVFSAPVSIILLFAPDLARPYPLIPSQDYCICEGCSAIFTLIDRAVASHPKTCCCALWTRAVVVFQDGHGMDVKAKRKEGARA